MADARSLLRQQRAARQQAQKPQKQSAAPAAAPASKKRKAPEQSAKESKRTRTEEEAGVPAGFFDAGAENHDAPVDAPVEASRQEEPRPTVQPLEPPKAADPPLDAAAAAELDAFMNEMNQEKPLQPPPTIYSNAVIESAPMTAAEIAAQARQDQSAQRAKNDEEMEGEKEDAARALEDEFEQMEGLEERVKRLREQREALRTKSAHAVEVKDDNPNTSLQEDDGDSASDDEDWDDWRFGSA
ncbi:hypothetical protein NX059_011289 [Plenodomus lindquistii]|nr:hypothetical protein NX059_011289 [Plenodomus lindquistii]